MKVFRVIKKIIIGIVGIIYLAFVVAITTLLLNFNKYGVTVFDDTSIVIIKEEISSDLYKKGDIVLVQSLKIDDVSVGDQLFAYKVDEEGVPHIDLGEVGEINYDSKPQSISYKNGETYSMEYVIGEATNHYEKVGKYLAILESKWGFLCIVLVPSLIIFIYEIYALLVEIKYGKEE